MEADVTLMKFQTDAFVLLVMSTHLLLLRDINLEIFVTFWLSSISYIVRGYVIEDLQGRLKELILFLCFHSFILLC